MGGPATGKAWRLLCAGHTLTTTFDASRKLALVRPPEIAPTATILGVVLAGERAWRNDSLESLGPRALLPVGDRPLIAYASEWLTESLVAVNVCTNVAAKRVWDALTVRHTSGRFSFDNDDSLRGPSGCVADVIARNQQADVIVVVEGSVIPTLDLKRLLRSHTSSRALATIVTQPRCAATADDRRADLPAGIYVFGRAAFDFVPTTGYQDIKEGLLRRMYEAGASVRVHEAEEWCPRVIDVRSYLAASQWAVRRLSRQRASAAVIDATAQISDGAMLLGPVVVGAGATIMDGASVIGPAVIGGASVIEANATVSRSMVWDNCTVRAGAFVDQTVLASGAAVAAGETLFHALRVPPRAAAKKSSFRLPWPAKIAPDVVTVGTTD